jgi:hypothetical protein
MRRLQYHDPEYRQSDWMQFAVDSIVGVTARLRFHETRPHIQGILADDIEAAETGPVNTEAARHSRVGPGETNGGLSEGLIIGS